MRAYFFVNSALSGIQKGLQVAHCVAEIGMRCSDPHFKAHKRWVALVHANHEDAYREWANDHKTIVVLEGGFHDDLRWIKSYFECGFNFKKTGTLDPSPYPWASFSEDEETMNGMMTCVGIIVPERIYGAAKEVREGNADLGKHGPEDEWWFSPSLKGVEGKIQERYDISGWSPYTGWEVELIKLLNSCPLAR